MKLKLTFIIVTFLFSAFSFGQTRVHQKDLEEVMMLAEQGLTDKAIARINTLRKVVKEKDSLYVYLIMTSAEINMKAFNCEGVISDNEEIIKMVPAIEIDCQMQIARFKKYLGDFKGAIIAYKRILELDSKKHLTYSNMASVYNLAGQYQDAVRVLNLIPDKDRLPSEYLIYAVSYLHLEKLDSAKFSIDKYLTTGHSANDFLAYKVAAQIYSALGEKKKSCEHITKANDIIVTTKPDEQISKQSKKNQDYYYIKDLLNQISEIRKKKEQLCGSDK